VARAGGYDSAVKPPATLRGVTAAAVVTLLVGCASSSPSPLPSPSATPTLQPSPTPTPSPITFPLAVVTGITNLKATVALDELGTLASGGQLVVPCGVTVSQPQLTATAPCVAADQIAADLHAQQELVALLPPGLVEPATKVLSIAGDGPFGLFGPDLFGAPEARALPYLVMGSAPADGSGALDPAWTAYDASQTWTLTAIGSLCADRQAAYQAVTLGKGWDWVFNGGTARYTGKPFLNPNPPAGISRYPIVQPVETGNDGVTGSISKRSDVALADHKCPILPTEDWTPNLNGPPSLAVPEAVLTRWKNFLGIDAVYLAADHQSDRGVTGIRSTLQLLENNGFPHTGLGMNLDQALEPAYVQVAGQKVAFVSWNEVIGPTHAGPTTPGAAWLTEENVNAAVDRARAADADLVICDPQWWGGDEYHPDLWQSQQDAVGWMDQAGCDQIIGGGLHVAGGIFLREHPNGVSLIDAGPGNYMYGQSWWQEVQEGVILDMTFRGKTLVNVRLHPYVMVDGARASLTDPEGDGHYVLERIWKAAEVDY
jgi:hypothetical protein